MSVLRARWGVTAAGMVAAGIAFGFAGSGTRAAQVIEIPDSEQTAAIPDVSAAAQETPAEPKVEVAQFPPPPFYIEPRVFAPSPRWSWPWESRPEQRAPQNELGQSPHKRRMTQDPNAAPQQREPNFALTRNMRGSYKDKIAALLDQPQSFPQPKGPLLLVVSIAKQTVTAYDAGVQFAKSPVSTGTPERPTPLGVFTVLEKQWWHRSNMYSAAPMPFMQRITWDGVALHAGELPGYRASHGCVRLPESFAYRLWYTSGVGARVVIAWNDLTPADISHPLLFQPTPTPTPPASEPTKPPQISPREIENAPMSVMYQPPAGDELDHMRDRMMIAAIDDGEPSATEVAADEDGHSPVQPAIALSRLDGSGMLDAQPVLDMLSARSKTRRHHLSRVSVPEYDVESILRPGPVSIFVSRRDSRIYVRKAMQPIFNMPVTIAQPSESIGTHVFTAVSAGGDGKLRWMVVSPAAGNQSEERYTRRRGRITEQAAATPSSTRAATAALDRIGLSQEAIDRIDDIVSVGATLIVSDAGLGRTAAIPDTDFSVVLRE